MPDTTLTPPSAATHTCCSTQPKPASAITASKPSTCCHGEPRHHSRATSSSAAAAAPAGASYVCPMDPEVRQSGPGACPKCGMALEPDLASIDLGPARVEYTCPMHPEVVREAPGACPLCGMALEPRAVQARSPPTPN